MKENSNPEINSAPQGVDPAEICECNPEWSNAPGNTNGDDCRCSIIDPTESSRVQDKKNP